MVLAEVTGDDAAGPISLSIMGVLATSIIIKNTGTVPAYQGETPEPSLCLPMFTYVYVFFLVATDAAM